MKKTFGELSQLIDKLGHLDKSLAEKYQKELLLKEAKRRYPVGTVCKFRDNSSSYTISGTIYYGFDGKSIFNGTGTGELWNGKTWAEIISKPEEVKTDGNFKKGDIIYIKESGDNNSAHPWYSWGDTTGKAGDILKIEDIDLTEKYGHPTIKSSKDGKSIAYRMRALRHATKEEIAKFKGEVLKYPLTEKESIYSIGINPYKKEVVKKKGFDEKEHLSKPYNQLLEVKIKKTNKKQFKLQLL